MTDQTNKPVEEQYNNRWDYILAREEQDTQQTNDQQNNSDSTNDNSDNH